MPSGRKGVSRLPVHEEVRAYLENYLCQEENLPRGERTRETRVDQLHINGLAAAVYTNEFWTARQRQASPLHEVSYRACFKPQLPRFFIELLTRPGQTVYDPFAGRGTTAVEAALLERRVISNDLNPLSRILAEPRLAVPDPDRVAERLEDIPLQGGPQRELDLSMFYHPRTESELAALRHYLRQRKEAGMEDDTDRWIRMVATNRLTGHSPGFFSVYSMPPNQAVSAERQVLINRKRNQVPEYRDVRAIILKKSRNLLKGLSPAVACSLRKAAETALFLEEDAAATGAITAGSVDLTVTSPPFLNVVQYANDNWLRCWFNAIDREAIGKRLTVPAKLTQWAQFMTGVFQELTRITKPGGWIAFEVGEIRKGKLRLEETILPIGAACGLVCMGVLINEQDFTKTSNIWGVKNNCSGTNSNRIVLFHRVA